MRYPPRVVAAALLLALAVPSFARAGPCSANEQLRILSGVAPRPSPGPITYVDLGQPGCLSGGTVNTSYLAPFANEVRVRAISYPVSPSSPPQNATYRFDDGPAEPLSLEWNTSLQTWDTTLEVSDANERVTVSAGLGDPQNVRRTFTVTYRRPESSAP